jgi:hypothetical protein
MSDLIYGIEINELPQKQFVGNENIRGDQEQWEKLSELT